jgi:hypothetical protein
LSLATVGWSKEKHTTHRPEGIPCYKTQNYKRHFIRFNQLPHLINTTIYQYIIIKIE